MKVWILGLAVLTATAGLASGVGIAPVLPDSDKVLFIGEDFEGNLIIEEVGLDHNAACGGFAPIQPDECTTGEHVRLGFVSHGFAMRPICGQGLGLKPPSTVGRCYIGAATSQLVHSAGMRTFVCQFQELPLGDRLELNEFSCSGSGTFPALGASFRHDCYSDDFGSSGAGESGTGLGDWRCSITHT